MTQTVLPPGPRRPAFVQTLEWVFAPESFMRRCAKRYGDTFTARLGPSADVVFLANPTAARAVFHGWPEIMNMGDINGLFRRVLGANSLLVLDGEEHMRQRRLLLPPFKGEAVGRHYGAMLKAAEDDVATWPVGTAMPLQPRMQAMTLNVILGAVFGLTGRTPWARLMQCTREVDRAVYAEIARRRQQTGRPADVLSLLSRPRITGASRCQIRSYATSC